MILTKTTHIFLYFTANTCYNSVKTSLIHEGGCLVDEKLSLSGVKIVQHDPLTLCFRQHKKKIKLLFALLLKPMIMFYNLWLYQCISIV